MFRWILIGILFIGLIGIGAWGYQEHNDKNDLLIQTENTYQRSFHDLSYNVDLLHNKIGTALAMNSGGRLSPQLLDIWKVTANSLTDVGQLPLSFVPIHKTETFLSRIGNFTYDIALRDLSKKPLTNDESKTLRNLYKESGEIKKQLRHLQYTVLNDDLRWMDVQLALAKDGDKDNTILDGLGSVEDGVKKYSDGDTNSPLLGNETKELDYLFLRNKPNIRKEDIIKQAQKILDISDKDNINITESGKGSVVPIYSVSYRSQEKNAYMDISKQGGYPLSLFVNRPVKENKLGLNAGIDRAKQFLNQNKLDNMVLFKSNQYGNVGVYSFLFDQDGIRVYSDSIQVKVALDNGDILGFTARNFYMNHQERDIPEPGITLKDAKAKVSSKINIKEHNLAVIDNNSGEEVLTYEFVGVFNENTFRIFINASDGKEEKVERLNTVETDFDVSM